MKYKIRTLSKKLLADLQTPVSIYLKIRDVYPYSALLESSDYHGGENSFSFIGFKPVADFKLEKNRITENFPDGQKVETEVNSDTNVPDCFLSFIQSFSVVEDHSDLGINGLFGYTAYDAVRYFEDVKIMNTVEDGSEVPDIQYVFYKFIIAVNHHKNELTVVENIFEGEESNMNEVLALLDNRNFASYNFSIVGEEKAQISDETYKQMVTAGKKHCYRGDTFQIVLSRRYSQQYAGDDFKAYRALRSINPSPYLFYFDLGSFRIFGSSPEAHLVVKKNRAYIDPIAGTFRRTGDDEKDLQLAEELRRDPKENAEHVMLVDLARNDLSRNTKNVKLEIFKEIQYYSHVLHMVSRVSGELIPGTNVIKLFADTFPAGTLSGAPKVRALELIDEIESNSRGFYGGCIGYIGLNGDFNQAITIRSFLSKNNVLYYQAGAGIVAKSDEESELQEVKNKLAALKSALDMAVSLKN
ncbi:MAG: anthranilate synthase component I family protein [Bacteroidales bacterium]|nr:anthranilate synthase component I family protein [Bacteroidales bacterium]